MKMGTESLSNQSLSCLAEQIDSSVCLASGTGGFIVFPGDPCPCLGQEILSFCIHGEHPWKLCVWFKGKPEAAAWPMCVWMGRGRGEMERDHRFSGQFFLWARVVWGISASEALCRCYSGVPFRHYGSLPAMRFLKKWYIQSHNVRTRQRMDLPSVCSFWSYEWKWYTYEECTHCRVHMFTGSRILDALWQSMHFLYVQLAGSFNM